MMYVDNAKPFSRIFQNSSIILQIFSNCLIKKGEEDISNQLKVASKTFSVPIDQLDKTIKRFLKETEKSGKTKVTDLSEASKHLFNEWKKFESFTKSIKNIQKKIITNIMFFIFNKALDAFKKDLRKNRLPDFETIFIIALSYKKIGDFNNAIKYFEESLILQNDNSNIIAQLADCYALIDQEVESTLIFFISYYC